MPKKRKRVQMNYIKNRNILINIERLKMEIRDAFWFGLGVGVSAGLFITLYLMSGKSDKKEVFPKTNNIE